MMAARSRRRATIAKHYTPADRVSGRYQYVPFEVPPGTARLRIAYQYDRNNGENVVDLGLFEPGLLDLGTPAFRGYSGGARTGIDLSADERHARLQARPAPARPLARPARPVQGARRAASTCRSISKPPQVAAPAHAPHCTAAGAPVHRTAPDAPVAPDAPAAPGWFTGALHTHTVHSDGTVTPADLLQMTRALGFDFVVITDHNNTTHRAELAQRAAAAERPLWIAGEEVTTPSGHASVWGLDEGEWVDFRVRAEDRQDRRAGLERASVRRAVLRESSRRPSASAAAGNTTFPADVDAIEISNGRHGEVAQGAGAVGLAPRQRPAHHRRRLERLACRAQPDRRRQRRASSPRR